MQCTPVRRGLFVPAGNLLVHPRWRDSELVAQVKEKVNIIFIGEIGVADFHTTSQSCLIYITEKDILSATNYKQRVAKLRNASGFQEKHVLVDKTELTKQFFAKLQDFVVLDCNMNLFPTQDFNDAAKILSTMVLNNLKSVSNELMNQTCFSPRCTNTDLLTIVQNFPKIGDAKAKYLLEHFGSLSKLAEATIEQLTSVIGLSAAKQLHEFLQ